MECVTCRSPRVSKFMDGFGKRRIFCRSCWVSFPESDSMSPAVHANFAAVFSKPDGGGQN